MAALALQPDAGGLATIALSGRLDAYSVGPLWGEARAAVRANPRAKLVVDCSRVEYCDGAGVALLVDLLRQPRPAGAEVVVRGLADRFQSLLDQFDPKALAPGTGGASPRPPLLERVGRAGVRFYDDLYALVAFLGEAAAALAYAVRHPQGIRWRDALRIAEEAGVNALPIVALIGFLMGVILAFQSAVAMKPFGAELFVANLLSLAHAARARAADDRDPARRPLRRRVRRRDRHDEGEPGGRRADDDGPRPGALPGRDAGARRDRDDGAAARCSPT